MSPYRKQVEKLYKRIIKVVGKGESYIRRYYDIIDEVIDYGKSDILQDTLLKFKIDTTTFNSIDDLKKNSFKKISFYINSNESLKLETLYLTKDVYRTGNHFFDNDTYQYIGDIQQIESNSIGVFIFNPRYMKSAISEFPTSIKSILSYSTQSLVYYDDKIYECADDYIWSYNNQITPTYSAYWNQVVPGTSSYLELVSATTSIIDKYSEAIDILRSYNFIYTYVNDFMEGDYVDDYLE